MNPGQFLLNDMISRSLIERLQVNFMGALKRIRLEIDMGEHGDDVLEQFSGASTMQEFAESLIELMCQWPLRDRFGALPCAEIMSESILELLNCNEFRNLSFTDRKRITFDIPYSHYTKEIALHLIELYEHRLMSIPEHLLTEEFLAEAVHRKSTVFHQLEKEQITPELAMIACQVNGMMIEKVPEKLRTQELCDVAFSQCNFAIEFIPLHMISHDMAKQAIETCGDLLKFIPEWHRSYELCLKAVMVTPDSAAYVPEHHKAKEFFHKAILANTNVYRYMDAAYRADEAFRLELIEQTKGTLFNQLSHKEMTKDCILRAISHDVMQINRIPGDLLTEEIALHAIRQRGEVIMMLPKEIITKGLVEEALKACPYAIAKLNNKHLDEELVLRAVKHDYKVFTILKKEHLTEAVLTEVIRQSGKMLEHVNMEFRDEDLCLTALANGDGAVPFLPTDLASDQLFWRKALSINPNLHCHVPRDILKNLDSRRERVRAEPPRGPEL